MSGTFDLYDVRCEQHRRTAWNPFLNNAKRVTLPTRINETFVYFSQPKYLTVSMDTKRLKEINDTMEVSKFFLVISYGLIRQSLNGTGTGTGIGTGRNGSLDIMLNTSHCNLCGNLNGTYTLALYQSLSRCLSWFHCPIRSFSLDHYKDIHV